MTEQFPELKIERRRVTRNRMGVSKSTENTRTNEGLITSVFSLGGRAVGRLEHETTIVMAAMAAGKSEDDLRQIVKSLHEARKGLFELFTREYAVSV